MDSRKITDPLNRGMVGGLLGMPADMLNILRNGGRSVGNLANRLAGVNAPPAPMVENPVYGQEWWGNKMQQAGYVSPNRNKLAEFGAGLLDPGSVMTDVPMLAKGLFGLGDPATTKMLGGLLGATVWHGSPHKFDKFDSSKIGTGEGAQAYGHGLYLAESPAVAKQYQDALSDFDMFVKGQPFNNADPMHRAAEAIRTAQDGGHSITDVAARLQRSIADLQSRGKPWADELAREQIGTLHALQSGKAPGLELKSKGALYKVDLPDEDIARMLDWDKPLSQQAPEVRGLLRKHGISGRLWEVQAVGDGPQGYLNDRFIYDSAIDARKQITELRNQGYYARPFIDGMGNGKTGAEFVRDLNDPAQQSERLRAMGIPGIRYLDGGSRGTGQGSSNFVVFPGNENRLKILERNGKPLK